MPNTPSAPTPPKTFKVLKDHYIKHPLPTTIPWDLVEPLRESCLKHHNQTLERLNERGGLAVRELYAHVNKLHLRDMNRVTLAEAVEWFEAWLEQHEHPPVDQLVSGAWYEQQYADPKSHYSRCYRPELPLEAKQQNHFHAGFVASLLCLQPRQMPDRPEWSDNWLDDKIQVLDLGSGVGNQLNTWEWLGFGVQGIEVSQTAVGMAVRYKQNPADDSDWPGSEASGAGQRKQGLGRGHIYVGSAADLSMFADGSFELASSNAFLEHIDVSICGQVLRETMRVARYGAHWIPMEVGNDPSHIHIQSRELWVVEMLRALGEGYVVGVVENICEPLQPLFLTMRKDDYPWSVERAATLYDLSSIHPR